MFPARIIFTVLIILFSTSFSSGQTAQNKLEIKWVKNIPDPYVRERKSPLQIIENIFLGSAGLNISRPVDIAISSKDNGWILSQGNGEIIKFKGQVLSPAKIKNNNKTHFKSLVSGCFINGTGLLFSDSAEENIYLLTEEGKLSMFCKEGILQRPTGIACNSKKQEIWVVESGGHRISVFNKDGSLLFRVGERGSGPGQFNFPTHIDIDNEGRVYIVDAMNFRIQIFNQNGDYLSSFGEHGDASGKFARPKGIAVDGKGNIYVADALFNAVQIFNYQGDLLYYFGKKGSGNGEFVMPTGLRIDDNGYIYVSDSYNNRIQVFKPSKDH
mgnify:CR=1 FL=1